MGHFLGLVILCRLTHWDVPLQICVSRIPNLFCFLLDFSLRVSRRLTIAWECLSHQCFEFKAPPEQIELNVLTSFSWVFTSFSWFLGLMQLWRLIMFCTSLPCFLLSLTQYHKMPIQPLYVDGFQDNVKRNLTYIDPWGGALLTMPFDVTWSLLLFCFLTRDQMETPIHHCCCLDVTRFLLLLRTFRARTILGQVRIQALLH